MKKHNKNKLIIYGAISLSLVALISVGFSSWILDGSIKDEASVTVNVGKITNKTLVVTVDEENSDFKLNFDNVKDPSNSNITNDSSSYEDMSFKIVYKLESTFDIKEKFTITLTIPEETVNAYKAINSSDYNFIDVSCLQESYSFPLPSINRTLDDTNPNIVTNVTYSNDDKVATVTQTFTFKWGTAFNETNPGNYNGSDWLTFTNNLQTFINNASKLPTIDITITPTYIE